MSGILRGINTIWSRLFDHKGFLQGEVQFVLREFEIKRNDQEIVQLFSIVENITDLKDSQIPNTKHLIDHIFQQLPDNLGQSLELCRSIEDLEAKYKLDTTLVEARVNRKLEWEQFIDDMTLNCKKIDNTFQEKEEELLEFYRDLETKLYLTDK